MNLGNPYINNIVLSLLFFVVFTGAIITLPIAIIQYRKNGFLGFKRTVMIYLFILFLQTIYILAIGPLPSIEQIANNPKPVSDFVNLIPFSFVTDIINSLSTKVLTIGNLVRTPAFYQMAFNTMMFIPMGLFLKNYFNMSFKKVVLIGFGFSLFIELTQLSGLYFIYPRPYRFFDVDDLMINTFGTIIGYVIAPLFKFMFPSLKEDLIKRYEKNKEIKMLPQYLMILLDLLIATFMIVVLEITASLINWYFNLNLNQNDIYLGVQIITFVGIFIIRPFKTKTYQTYSMSIMRYELYSDNKFKLKFIIRNILIYVPLVFHYKTLPGLYHFYFIIMILFKKKQIIFDKLLKMKFLKYYE